MRFQIQGSDFDITECQNDQKLESLFNHLGSWIQFVERDNPGWKWSRFEVKKMPEQRVGFRIEDVRFVNMIFESK